jgi:hypothetical protein
LSKQIQVSAQEAEALVLLLAEQQLRANARLAECAAEPSCNQMDSATVEARRQREDLVAYLGPEKYQRYEQYTDSLQERREVKQLQSRLPSQDALSEDRAERLIAALADERRETVATAEANGQHVEGVMTVSSTLWGRSARDGATPEARLESATE